MLKSIQEFFQQQFQAASAEQQHSTDQLHLATAALLIEMTRADHDRVDEEMQAVCRALKRAFLLDDGAIDELLRLAETEAADMTSYYSFTSLIKNGFQYSERVQIIEMLWEVAHADNRIDHHEEHMIRKIAGLLYVRREDIVASKHRALAHHQRARQ